MSSTLNDSFKTKHRNTQYQANICALRQPNYNKEGLKEKQVTGKEDKPKVVCSNTQRAPWAQAGRQTDTRSMSISTPVSFHCSPDKVITRTTSNLESYSAHTHTHRKLFPSLSLRPIGPCSGSLLQQHIFHSGSLRPLFSCSLFGERRQKNNDWGQFVSTAS